MVIEVTPLAIPDVKLIKPKRFEDHRGFFEETYNWNSFVAEGIHINFVQDNRSLSETAGTVRGLHFQAPPRAQDKLLRCGRGRLFDVAVDIRRGSPTYGQWVGAELSFKNGQMLFVPVGFAHGFATLEPGTEVVYKCSDTYAPETEGAIRFDDPDLGIDWHLGANKACLSEKDTTAPLLCDFNSPFTYGAKS